VRTVLGIVGLLVVALLVAAVGLALLAYSRMAKVDATPDGDRPPDGPGRTFLLVGSDRRDDLSPEEQQELGTGRAGGNRTDTILLLHDSASGPTVLVSLPRDSYVPIPGHGRNKLNAAYALGGPELLVQTVEDTTGVHVDDYVEIGFGGFNQVVEAVGGVELCLDEPLQDERAHIDLPAGCQVLGGADALGFVRARYTDPRGDLGRVERQQEFLGALVDRATSAAVLANPLRATRTAIAVGDALTIGEDTGPIDLVFFGRAMLAVTGPDGLRITVPVAGTPTLPGVGSVVRWDRERALALFDAIAEDRPIPAEVLDREGG
jgi:LCP family protein required for cell wall assembly